MSLLEIIEALSQIEFQETNKKDVGYIKEEVDSLIQSLHEQLVTAYENEQRLENALADAENETISLKANLKEARDSSNQQSAPEESPSSDVSNAVTLLGTAERIAREHVEEAQAHAETVRNDATDQAESIIEGKRAEYEDLSGKIVDLESAYEQAKLTVRTSLHSLLGEDSPSSSAATPASPVEVVTALSPASAVSPVSPVSVSSAASAPSAEEVSAEDAELAAVVSDLAEFSRNEEDNQ